MRRRCGDDRNKLDCQCKDIAYSVPLFRSIFEAQSGTRETIYDFAEEGTKDLRVFGNFDRSRMTWRRGISHGGVLEVIQRADNET